jgi:hypothetical protein
MKKLYFLNEEEKNRILNLHESATKRQYLSEFRPSVFYTSKAQPTNSAQKKTAEEEKRWSTLYSCVVNQAKKLNIQPTKYSDGSTSYLINGYTYYNNGIKAKSSTEKLEYNCQTEFVDPDQKQKNNQQKMYQQRAQQVTKQTQDLTKQIQALLGLEKTGNMDTGLLQKINTKLNGGK